MRVNRLYPLVVAPASHGAMMPRHRMPLLLLLLAPAAAHAQSTLDPGCAAPEHRQFDFWVGSWTVTDSTGRVLGENDIARVAGGCGLREHWRGAHGGEGMSLNVWQPALERWTQFWVGTGVVLELTGGLDVEGRMVLQGERETPDGPLLDRITWTPLPSGDVRQQWDISRNEGASWQPSFDGVYRPRTVHGFIEWVDENTVVGGPCRGRCDP